MPNFGPNEIALALLTMLLLLGLWGMVIGWGWLIWRLLTGQSILPERPMVSRGEPPWGLGTVLFIFVPLIASQVNSGQLPGKADTPTRGVPLTDMNPVTVREKESPRSDARPEAPAPEVAPALDDKPAANKPVGEKKVPMYRIMLHNAVAEIVMLVVVLIVPRLTSGARLRDFGLSFDGWWRQAALGVVATLIAAPPVNALQFLATKIWTYQPHPVQEMMLKEFSAGVGGLAFVTAVILAPLFEELVFRGLLQGWLVARLDCSTARAPIHLLPTGPSGIPTNRSCATDCLDPRPEPEPSSPDAAPKSQDSPPTNPPRRAWIAIVLTSLLFAFVHAPQWPAPIALFALALVIGTVYYRTGSLIAAIFMHATFNGLSTLVLFISLVSGVKFDPDKVIRQTADATRAVRMQNQQLLTVGGMSRSL